MTIGQDDPASGGTLARTMAQAAASLASANPRRALEALGATAQQAGRGSWIEQLLAPYRQALGAIAGLVPGIMERVAQVVGTTAEQMLLFRASSPYDARRARAEDGDAPRTPLAAARALVPALAPEEMALYEFVDRFGGDEVEVLVTPALHERLQPVAGRAAGDKAAGALRLLTEEPLRAELPSLLDELRQVVRADRAQGFAYVHDRLQWLLKSGRTDFAPAYALLRSLTDVLGEHCLREVRRERFEERLLAVQAGDDTAFDVLRRCFGSFGHLLSDRVSVLRSGSDDRAELLVLDHGRDRSFRIVQGQGSTERFPWAGAEIRGSQVGHDYAIGGMPFKLPLREHDAAQGFATWSVDRRLVQESRELFSGDRRLGMAAWDMGGNRTPVAMFFVHHRDSDAGEYFELGLGCFAAPRSDPLSIGFAMLATVLVSERQGQEVGQTIWGIPKQLVDTKDWTVQYRPDHLQCSVDLEFAKLALRLPRGGFCCSSAMPVLLYTSKPSDERRQWHRSSMMRFASGESVRIGGAGVDLHVELHDREKAFTHPLIAELHRLGLIDRGGQMPSRAMHSAWAEHVTAQLGAPILVPTPDPECD